jgi:hypothetical protein
VVCADHFDDCDGHTFAALADEECDHEYDHSKVIDFESGKLLDAAPRDTDRLADFVNLVFFLPVKIDGPSPPSRLLLAALQVPAGCHALRPDPRQSALSAATPPRVSPTSGIVPLCDHDE